MAYEYEKENIEAVMINPPKANRELREVYSKARAFDEVKEFVDKKLKEKEEKSHILDDYEYGMYQAYDFIDDVIQEHLKLECE